MYKQMPMSVNCGEYWRSKGYVSKMAEISRLLGKNVVLIKKIRGDYYGVCSGCCSTKRWRMQRGDVKIIDFLLWWSGMRSGLAKQ